jgi:hypothetical protein
MTQFNSLNSKSSLPSGIRQTIRRLVITVAAITAVLVLAGTILGLSGCSQDKDKVNNDKVNTKDTSLSTGSSQGTAGTRRPVLRTVKLASKTQRNRPSRRVPVEAYSNSDYGVSFRFPSRYELTTPGENQEHSAFPEDVPMNFVQPGGITLATIELPSGSETSFFSVSVNKQMTPWQCQQFAVPNSPAPANVPVGVGLISSQANGSQLTFVSEQEDVRYYHHFEPAANGNSGTCYEFALGVEESRISSTNLNRPQLFEQLESILATVELKSQPFTRMSYMPASESGSPTITKGQ